MLSSAVVLWFSMYVGVWHAIAMCQDFRVRAALGAEHYVSFEIKLLPSGSRNEGSRSVVSAPSTNVSWGHQLSKLSRDELYAHTIFNSESIE